MKGMGSALGIALLVSGCAEHHVVQERLPPRIIGIEPGEYTVDKKTHFAITFSKQIALEGLEEAIQIVDADAMEVAIKSIPKKARIPCQVTLDETQKILAVQPKYLKTNTRYKLLLTTHLRDTDGNPLVDHAGLKADFQYEFRTQDAPPQIIAHDLPVRDDEMWENGRTRFSIQFSHPMAIFDRGALMVTDTDAASLVVPEALVYFPEENRLEVQLDPLQGFVPEHHYTVALSDAFHSEGGLPLEPTQLVFRAGGTVGAMAIEDTLTYEVEAYDTSARFTLSAAKPVQVKIWYGPSSQELQCMGNACPLTTVLGLRRLRGKPEHLPTFLLTGLMVDTPYVYHISVGDMQGHYTRLEGQLLTSAMASLVISEVMANPQQHPESVGEYVEIWNHGTAPLSLEGYALEIEQDKGKIKNCPVPTGVQIDADGYVLLVGQDFEIGSYPGLRQEQVVKLAGKSVCGALSNGTRQKIMLKDEKKRTVSIFWAPFAAKEKGRSIERAGTVYCYARQDIGPTPGKANSIAAKGCEEPQEE